MKAANSVNIELAFRPRARIMQTLGQELISNETVAVIELVKNSFDADATQVLIRFSGPLEKGLGSIEIIDNGHGMSIDDIRSGWMELATNSKRKRTRSNHLKRKLLGEKGIGRFACSRLANELELITRSIEQSKEIYALFDWTQFEDEELYLDQIEVLIDERTPEVIVSRGITTQLTGKEQLTSTSLSKQLGGTVLRMNKLKMKWTDSDFVDLQRVLSRLISPFSQFSDFNIRLELPNELASFSSDISTPEIIRYPHYSVQGSVLEDGSYEFTLKVYATGITIKRTGRFLRGTDKETSILLMLTTEQSDKSLSVMSDDEIRDRSIQTGPLDIELRIWDRYS